MPPPKIRQGTGRISGVFFFLRKPNVIYSLCQFVNGKEKVRIFATAFSIEVERLIRKARQGIQTLILNAFSFFPKVLYLRARAKALFSLIGDRGTLIPAGCLFCLKSDPLPPEAREYSRAILLKHLVENGKTKK